LDNYFKELELSLDGRSLHYIEAGDPDGEVVLALHGWLDNAASFIPLVNGLKGYRLIIPDLAGHGRSFHRDFNQPYYIWDNVSDLISFMDQLEIEQCHLLGHSMGAAIGSIMASLYSERFIDLVMVEASGPVVYQTQGLSSQMRDALDKREKMRSKILRPYASIDDMVQVRMNGMWPVGEGAARYLVGRGVVKKSDGFYWSADPALMLPGPLRLSEQQVQSLLADIELPVLLVKGDDGMVEPELEARVGCIRGIRFEILPGAHHLHLEPETLPALVALLCEWWGAGA